MTKGPGRFEYYLIQLDQLLAGAAQSGNAALDLYQHDARTKLFMLEGLAKLYEGLHDKSLFSKIKNKFKSLEDLIGAIDYYDAFAKDFFADPGMPVTARMALEQKRDEKIAALNKLLRKDKWFSSKYPRTKKIRKQLMKAAWRKPEKEIAAIGMFYTNAIKKIDRFYEATGENFTSIETQVHSIRRKLRWLSIYPQALQGAIQLTTAFRNNEALKKYLTPEIVSSPFNKLPPPRDNEITLVLDKDHFLALSFMISALGELKDKGLRVIATAEAIKNTQFLSDENAVMRALELNGMDAQGLENIMQEAKALCRPYFEEKLLEKIMTKQAPASTEENIAENGTLITGGAI